jgi:hypothetical protein
MHTSRCTISPGGRLVDLTVQPQIDDLKARARFAVASIVRKIR